MVISGKGVMPTKDPETEAVLPEMVAWRKGRWMLMGWSLRWADFLSTCNMDYHYAEKLLSKGATQTQIVRMLAGLSPLGEDQTFDYQEYYSLLLADELDSMDIEPKRKTVSGIL